MGDEQQQLTVRTMPANYHENWGISREAVETFWERAASHILAEEDKGNMRPTKDKIYRMVQEANPELYPAKMPFTLKETWWSDPEWKQYLALRRQEHYLRTMPTRIEITRYANQLLQAAGTELVKRVYEDPESVPTKELVSIMREATKALVEVDADIRVAQGDESGNKVTLNVYQFLEQLPPDRREVVAAAIASKQVGAVIEPQPEKVKVLGR